LDKFNLKPDNILPPKQGRLLVSEPFQEDSYFSRTVILLCEHNEEGSLGFVMNNYVELNLSDLISNFPDSDSRLAIGGPVDNGKVFYLHRYGNKIKGSHHVVDDIYMGGDFNQLKNLMELEENTDQQLRFFIGYSGWSETQLEDELRQHAWYVSEVNDLALMDTNREDLWGSALRKMGGDFANLANFPTDPSLN
jgi:putative transcriptional regulator